MKKEVKIIKKSGLFLLADTEDHTYKVHPNLRNKIDE